MKITTCFFSATYTTRKVVERFVGNFSDEKNFFDITNDDSDTLIRLSSDDLFVVGVPVYAGRVPAMAVERIRRFKGEGTAAVAVAVYGNRDYDDALLELSDILNENGFRVMGAGAFVAQHSIFPKVGANRPDEEDYRKIDQFAEAVKTLLQTGFGAVEVKGNRPYKQPGAIPIWPTGSGSCMECGKCATLCPTGAIDASAPRGVNQEKCIKCGRCIVVCPSGSRKFRGLKYFLASWKFNKAFSDRREPEVFLAEGK